MTNEYYGAHTDLVPGTMARSGDINAMDQAIVEAFDKVPSAKQIKQGNLNYAVDKSITANAYVVTMDAVVTAYVDGLEVKMKPISANTGPATLNINGIGNVTIRRQDNTPVQSGDILAQGPLTLTYNASTNAFHIPPTGNAHVVAAANSAAAAAQSASAAGTSASTASTAATTATTKAGEANASASTASTASTTASTKAGEAATSAGNAAGSASAAATSASNAATSAQNLAAAVTTATGAATTATTKAGEAATSASNAATSATNLANAVSAAQAAQSLAQQWASGSGIVANGKYSAEYYAGLAQSAANAMATGQVQADWNQTDPAQKSFIQNKPVISVAANFAAGNTHTVSSEPNALRAVANPATGLGYAGGVRFRFGSMDDSGNAGDWADIMDLSTYSDSSGGGVNALYFGKNRQRIIHKYAAAGATAWTVQQLAYLSDLSAYLPLAGGGTLTGGRPITFDTTAGTVSLKGDLGGWACGYIFKGGNGTQYGGFTAYGSTDVVNWYSIGDAYNSGWLTVLRGSGKVLMGSTTDDGSGARLQVAGPVKATSFIGNLAGNADTATNATTAINATKLGGAPLASTNGSGSVWGCVPLVNTDGVMEIGRFIDFHHTSGDTNDSASRLHTDGSSNDLFINGNKIFNAGINRTNYKGITDSFVAGQLMWAAYGANHTIFDASAGTSPSGVTLANSKDAQIAWGTTNDKFPTLMGWSAGGTSYGVRVDSARVADTIASGSTLTNPVLVKPTIKDYIEQLQALNPGSTVTIDPANGTLIELTTTVASTTITLPAAVAGRSLTMMVKYGSTGHTLTFAGGTSLRWANGNTVPQASSVAGKIDCYVFTCGTGYTVGRDGWRNA